MPLRLFTSIITLFAFFYAGLAYATVVPIVPAPRAVLGSNISPALGHFDQQLRLLINQPTETILTSANGQSSPPVPANPASLITLPHPEATIFTADTDTSDYNPTDIIPNFGTRLLNLFTAGIEVISDETQTAITNFYTLPQLADWITHQVNNSKLKERWLAITDDCIASIIPALIIFGLVELSLLPIRKRYLIQVPATYIGRIKSIGALYLLRMTAIAFFIVFAIILLNHYEQQKFPHYIVLNIIYALALSRITLITFRAALAPKTDALRLVALSAREAAFGYRWLGVFTHLIIFGYFIIELAKVVRVPDSAISTFTNIFALIIVLFSITVIFQIRPYIANILSGNITKRAFERTWFESLRVWLAHYWHILAISYLTIAYLITALSVQNGFSILLRGTISTLVILIITRLLLHAIIKWVSPTPATPSFHRDIVGFLFRIFIWVAGITLIAAAWGADIAALMSTQIGHRIYGSMLSLFVTVITLIVAYEFLSSRIDRHINRLSEDGLTLYASARARTLLPMIRNTVFCVFAAVTIMVGLSEAGLNIAPILAGAGIVGVAIGFGSQTLVKDFLTGLFIVIENTIAVGDVVQIGTHSGVVEGMSIRTIRIRDQDGSLHILPFSETSNIINMTRGFGYAVFKIAVSYDTDLDHASDVMRAVGEEMQEDPVFRYMILDPIEILGVDSLGDYAITLLARIRTRTGKQWDVKRRYLLNLKKRFDVEGIEIPFPTSMQIHRHPVSTPNEGT